MDVEPTRIEETARICTTSRVMTNVRLPICCQLKKKGMGCVYQVKAKRQVTSMLPNMEIGADGFIAEIKKFFIKASSH
jgi:hypothetical protein